MTDLVENYVEKAEATGCKVVQCKDMLEVQDYIVNLVKTKQPCELLDEEDCEKGPLSPLGLPTRVTPIVAAPFCENGLEESFFEALHAKAEKENFICIKNNLRNHLSGIDIGVVKAMHGIAQTGTCMIDTSNEDARFSTIICEICVTILKKSDIKPDLLSMADILRGHINSTSAGYTTFMSGPSRTADIERVGAVGVHGSLEAHILLLDE